MEMCSEVTFISMAQLMGEVDRSDYDQSLDKISTGNLKKGKLFVIIQKQHCHGPTFSIWQERCPQVTPIAVGRNRKKFSQFEICKFPFSILIEMV